MTAPDRLATIDAEPARWFTSSYSGAQNECVEVADGLPGVVPVRDSKDPAGPKLLISPRAWREFVRLMRR